MTKDQPGSQVLNPNGARKLLEGGMEELSDDERALLLAMMGVEAETGKDLGEEARAAMEALGAQLEGYDADELAQAVKHMVSAEPRGDRELEWPDLKDKLRDR